MIINFKAFLEQEEALYPNIPAELPGIELKRSQTEDQMDGPIDTVDDEPNLIFRRELREP